MGDREENDVVIVSMLWYIYPPKPKILRNSTVMFTGINLVTEDSNHIFINMEIQLLFGCFEKTGIFLISRPEVHKNCRIYDLFEERILLTGSSFFEHVVKTDNKTVFKTPKSRALPRLQHILFCINSNFLI